MGRGHEPAAPPRRLLSLPPSQAPPLHLPRSCRGRAQSLDSEQTITPILDAAGRISHFVSVGKDLTEMRRSLERDQKLRLARSVQQRMHPTSPPGYTC